MTSSLELIVHNDQTFALSGHISIHHDPWLSQVFAPLLDQDPKAEGGVLLELLHKPHLGFMEGSWSFWLEILNSFFRCYCSFLDQQKDVIWIQNRVLKDLWDKRPLCLNHLTMAKMISLSQSWFDTLETLSKAYPSERAFIEAQYQEWKDVGLFHFHLAESPQGSKEPFVFLATTGTLLWQKTRLQHIPIGEKLKTFTSEEKISFLKPVVSLFSECPFLEQLSRTGQLYRVAYLSAEDAFSFLKESPLYERKGILVKTPKTWLGKGSAPKPVQWSVQLEEKKQGLFTLKGVWVVDGQECSDEFDPDLLEKEGALIRVQGQWAVVEGKKLKNLLHIWKRAMTLSQEKGLSLGQVLSFFQKELISPFLHSNSSDYGSWLLSLPDLSSSMNHTYKDAQELESALSQVLKPQIRLRDYQIQGIRWMFSLLQSGFQGGCLADDMGLGKTLQVISFLALQKGKKSLIIVPSSLLGNWQEEFQRFVSLGLLKISLFYRLDVEFDVCLCSYGKLPPIGLSWDMIILDEAQHIKNPGAQRTERIKAIAAKTTSFKVALTGTPIENSPLDLWSILNFCSPDVFSQQSSFLALAQSHPQVLGSQIAPYLLRRKKKDYLKELPDKIERKVICPLTKEQWTLYREYLKELFNHKDEQKALILKTLLRLKQLCNHPSQCLGDQGYEPHRSGKWMKFFDLAEKIREEHGKVLVFTQFYEIIDVLERMLTQIFWHPGITIHGKTPISKRQELVHRFQDESQHIPFAVISLKAGGTGLNLTKANHVIHLDRWWNPGVENQASDRAYRLGQTQTVFIHQLVTKGSIEEKIDSIIQGKAKLETLYV